MRSLLGALMLAPVLTCGLWAQEAPVPRDGPQSGAVISRVSGETVRFVAEPQFRPLVLAQDLLGGDLVATGAAGVVGILFVDGTVMRLHPRTELLVKSVGTAAELELRRGTIWARAARGRSDITVTTPAAAAGIRGTDWVLAVEGGGLTRLTVYDGAVELSNPQGSVLTGAGEAAVASPGRAPVKVGVANRREAEQMLYTVGTSEAADLLSGAVEDLAGGAPEEPRALAEYRTALALLRLGDPKAAGALERVAPRLGGERAAGARWLAAFARMDRGAPLRAPSPSTADADAIGAAVAAAMRGDLDRAQDVLESVGSAPTALAAATQIAILRDDAPRAARLVGELGRRAPGSRPALEAAAAYASGVAGDHAEARRLLLQAIALDNRRAFLWNALGLEEDALDHPLEAEAAFRRALALEPGNPAAMGNLAILLLDLERVDEARALAREMLRRDPSSYLGLRAMGRADLQSGDPGAETVLLRALAAQPAAAETSIALGIAAHMSGDTMRGDQEFEAAGRLDPNDPVVPLVQSITAFDANRIDDAIVAGRRAGELFNRQDASGRIVAADRQTGAALVNAYATIGLDGWARLAADRTHDPLSAASLFSEGYLGRLTLGRDGPSSDGHDGSVVNGLLLEPLAASYRLRFTDILRRPFTDAGISLDFGRGDVISGIELQGLARAPLPLAYALTLSGFDATGRPGQDRLRGGQFLAGTQWGARGGGFATIGRTATRTRSGTFVFPGLETLEDARVTSDTAALGGHFRLNDRSFLIFFLGHARRQNDAVLRNFIFTPASVFQLDTRGRQDLRSDRLNLGYRAEDASGFWTAGLELGRVTERSDTTLTVTDLLTGVSQTVDDATDARIRSLRAYVGRRHRLGADLTSEWLITLDRVGDETRTGGRLGFSWSPAAGHWLRAALIADGNPGLSSLVPASVLGLVPLRLPYRADGRLSGAMARYDVEVGERLLLGIEHQRLDLRNLTYDTADPSVSLDPDRARLSATSVRADWWIGEGVGVAASLTRADSRMRHGPFAGAPLPHVPDWTATAGIGWLRPSGFGGALNAVWTGHQFSHGAPGRLDPVLTVDASLSYETRNKRLAARLEVTNLFDRPVASPRGGLQGGREVRLSLAARF